MELKVGKGNAGEMLFYYVVVFLNLANLACAFNCIGLPESTRIMGIIFSVWYLVSCCICAAIATKAYLKREGQENNTYSITETWIEEQFYEWMREHDEES